jgi:cytochrome c553
MTSARAGLLVATLLLASGCALAGSPGLLDLRNIEPVHGDAGAGKNAATVCGACHGADGVSPIPMFPSLAGQPAEFLYWRLVDIQREARPESPMTPIVAPLDDATLRDLAAYFASLSAPPAAPASDPVAMHRGGELFLHGDAAAGVPPCQGCHGAHGEGHPLAESQPRYRTYPMLRGQHAAYLVSRLQAYRAAGPVASSNARIMQGTSHGLDDDAINDVAAWLEAQPVPPAPLARQEE